jgi:hypothetical protein
MVHLAHSASVSTRALTTYDSDGNPLMTASGFVVEGNDGQPFLISNRHVLAGLKPGTNEYMDKARRIPFFVDITFLPTDGELKGIVKREVLIEDGAVRWLQHPSLRDHADCVALPLTDLDGVNLMPVGLISKYQSADGQRPLNVVTKVPDAIFVVGFPLGMNGGSPTLSIWTQATVATEVGMDQGGLPRFLIDSRTRSGLSGAPVYRHIAAGSGIPLSDGEYATVFLTGDTTDLIGIYSSRVDDRSDLGYVWKKQLIAEIVSAGIPGTPMDDIFRLS